MRPRILKIIEQPEAWFDLLRSAVETRLDVLLRGPGVEVLKRDSGWKLAGRGIRVLFVREDADARGIPIRADVAVDSGQRGVRRVPRRDAPPTSYTAVADDEGDLADRGRGAVEAVEQATLPRLFAGYDQVWHW